jgi:hypothetical protein
MKKKTTVVVSVLAVILIAVAGAIVFKSHQDNTAQNNNQKEETKMKKLPTITLKYGDEVIGKLDGYTMAMDESLMRDVIVPISTSHKVPMVIKTQGNKIKTVKYEVKEYNNNGLVDNGTIEDWKENGGTIDLTYQASAIMEQGKEYFLKFIIETASDHEVYYYTRATIMNGDKIVPNQIKFAKKFSENTFNEEKSSDVAAYLEPNSKYASDSLGQATIRSTLGMVIWKTFRPKKISDVVVSAKDIYIKDTGESGTYTLNYQIEATNAQKVKEKYNVAETVTVWTFKGKNYILAYNREVNQIWDCNENNVGNSFIDLGIQKQTTTVYKESSNQQYIAYEINGDVYVMDIIGKNIKSPYKLKAKSSETLYKTKAKVVNVDDKGNLTFIIYGYSTSGYHRGKNGISVMDYNWEKNTTTEIAFIPSDEPSQILTNEMKDLCYKGDGTVYLMINNTIYYVNLKTKEWGTLVENLNDGSCVSTDDGKVIAYNTNGTLDDSDSITVVDLSTGTKKEITEPGHKITVCGFTGENLVYGMAKVKSTRKYARFPITTLKIVDNKLQEVKTYKKSGVILSNIEVTDSVISFNKWKNNKKIGDDQILNNTEIKQPVAKSSFYMDDIKMQELAIAFTNNLDSNTALKVNKPSKVTFDSNVEVLNADIYKDTENKFFVYSYGRLYGIYDNKKSAISAAKENFGVIVDGKGTKIWTFEDNYNN